MRFIPRRKRTWLLAVLALLIVMGGAIWWAASEKSDFERRFDKIKIGMPNEEAVILMGTARPSPVIWQDSPDSSPIVVGCDWTEEGEQATVVVNEGRITAKDFTPLDARGRLRRMWTRVIGSKPPF
jgi:hypothetical protein